MTPNSLAAALGRSFVALSILASLARAGAVIVVDGGGGGAHSQIQPAVAAAADGDTLLVKSGSYDGFVVDGKALQIVGDTGHYVHVDGTVRVANLPLGKLVVLANLEVLGTTYGLDLASNAGSVRVERCTFVGQAFPGDRDGCDGAHVVSCADVAFGNCSMTGGRGVAGSAPGVGGCGLSTDNSRVALYGCQVMGGTGVEASGNLQNGGWGGDACRARRKSIHATGSAFYGGSGGDGHAYNCVDGGDGGEAGYAVRLLGSECVATMQWNGEGGGTSGTSEVPGMCGTFDPGYAYPARSGSVFANLLSPYLPFTLAPVAREGSVASLDFVGTPGDRVALLVSASTQFRYRQEWEGVLLVDHHPLHRALLVGTIEANGALSVPFQWPELPLGEESAVWHVQPLTIDPWGSGKIAPAATVVVVDGSF